MKKGRIKNKWKMFYIGLMFMVLCVGIAYAYGSKVNEQKDDMTSIQWVSHTEYWRDDKASSIVRIADYKGDPLAVDSCYVTILYPNKTIFVDNQPLSQSGISGNWYRTDALIGVPFGTYEQEVTCYTGPKALKSSQSFHVNPALEEIEVVSGKVDSQDVYLGNMDLEIKAKIDSSKDEVVSEIRLSNTTLSTLIADARDAINANTDSAESLLSGELDSVEISVNGKIIATGDEIKSDIAGINTTISAAIEELKTRLDGDITARLDAIQTSVNNVKTDTAWIVSNAMNQEDMTEISGRFNNIDTNMASLMQSCSNVETNSSELCQKLYNIESIVARLESEQNSAVDLSEINETTFNTWQLLSGEIAIEIDSILTDLGIIKEQTTEINQTTHQILDEMQSEVHIQIIS